MKEERLSHYGFRIERTSKRIKQNLQRRFNAIKADLTVDQWVLLDVLRRHPGIGQFEIANMTFKDAPTVTRIIDILCKKGLCERVVNREDRRRFRIFLTKKGEKRVKELIPVVQEMREQGWKSLSEEDYHQLMRILDQVFENFSAESDEQAAFPEMKRKAS